MHIGDNLNLREESHGLQYDNYGRHIGCEPAARSTLAGRYVEITERTHAYLDPREMALVDRQADSLRERKRY